MRAQRKLHLVSVQQRERILGTLRDGPASTVQIAGRLGYSRLTVAAHLRDLEAGRLAQVVKHGRELVWALVEGA